MSKSFEHEGALFKVMPTDMKNPDFPSRKFWLHQPHESNPKYDDYLEFKLSKDKCTEIDRFRVGESIKVMANSKGRLWLNPKTNIEVCFNTYEVWRIDAGAQASASGNSGGGQGYSAPPSGNIPVPQDEDPLPF